MYRGSEPSRLGYGQGEILCTSLHNQDQNISADHKTRKILLSKQMVTMKSKHKNTRTQNTRREFDLVGMQGFPK